MSGKYPMSGKYELSINYQSLILELDQVINFRLAKKLIFETGFEIVNLASDKSSVSAFLTEQINKLALSFEIKYNLADVENEDDYERKNALLTAKGDCLYEFDTKVISNVNIDFEEITWLEPTGESGRRGLVYLRCIIGRDDSQIPYTFRKELR
jgi:hypothetical protein